MAVRGTDWPAPTKIPGAIEDGDVGSSPKKELEGANERITS